MYYTKSKNGLLGQSESAAMWGLRGRFSVGEDTQWVFTVFQHLLEVKNASLKSYHRKLKYLFRIQVKVGVYLYKYHSSVYLPVQTGSCFLTYLQDVISNCFRNPRFILVWNICFLPSLFLQIQGLYGVVPLVANFLWEKTPILHLTKVLLHCHTMFYSWIFNVQQVMKFN